MKYTSRELLRLAKRFNNQKRSYLLVDPLQGKHIPVSPTQCLDMLHSMGGLLKERYPEASLVIGFAETATAVGAAAAEMIGDNCTYFQTTRENVGGVARWVEFLEEHSHATEQKLAADNLEQAFTKTQTVIFIDDELSTGKTLMNMIVQLRGAYPELNDKKIVAASIINRMSQENTRFLANEGIECCSLLKIDNVDYTQTVEVFDIKEQSDIPETECVYTSFSAEKNAAGDPRTGVVIGEYISDVLSRHNALIKSNESAVPSGKRLVVIGTEECMYPGLLIAREYENSGRFESVRFHATTRSPIGICDDEDYPAKNGYKLQSFYEKDRQTYLYNLAEYDSALVVTDSRDEKCAGAENIAQLLHAYGCAEVIIERI